MTRTRYRRELFAASFKRLAVALYLRDLLGIHQEETFTPLPPTNPPVRAIADHLPRETRAVTVEQWNGWWGLLLYRAITREELPRLLIEETAIGPTTTLDDFPELVQFPQLQESVATQLGSAAGWAAARNAEYSELTFAGHLEREGATQDFMVAHGEAVQERDIEGAVLDEMSLWQRGRRRSLDLRIVVIPVQGRGTWQVGGQQFLVAQNLRADPDRYDRWLSETVRSLLS